MGCGRLSGMFNLMLSNVVIYHLNEYQQVKKKLSSNSYLIYNVVDMKSISGRLVNPNNKNDFMPFKLILLQRVHDYDDNHKNDYSIGVIIRKMEDFKWFKILESKMTHPDVRPLNVKPTFVKKAKKCNLFYRSNLASKNREKVYLSEAMRFYEVYLPNIPEKKIAMRILQHLW